MFFIGTNFSFVVNERWGLSQSSWRLVVLLWSTSAIKPNWSLLKSTIKYEPPSLSTFNENRDRSKIVFVKDDVAHKKGIFLNKFSELFPKIKIDSVLHTEWYTMVIVVFYNSDNAQRVLANWQPNYFGSNTSFSTPRHSTYHAILRNAPIIDSFSKVYMHKIKQQYTSVSVVVRFTKNNTNMPVVKVSFCVRM